MLSRERAARLARRAAAHEPDRSRSLLARRAWRLLTKRGRGVLEISNDEIGIPRAIGGRG